MRGLRAFHRRAAASARSTTARAWSARRRTGAGGAVLSDTTGTADEVRGDEGRPGSAGAGAGVAIAGGTGLGGGGAGEGAGGGGGSADRPGSWASAVASGEGSSGGRTEAGSGYEEKHGRTERGAGGRLDETSGMESGPLASTPYPMEAMRRTAARRSRRIRSRTAPRPSASARMLGVRCPGILGERLVDQLGELGGHVGRQLAERAGLAEEVLLEHLEQRRRRAADPQRVHAGQRLVEDDAHGVDVGPRVRGLRVELLGRHVERGAEHVLLAGPGAPRAQLGDAEIDHLDHVGGGDQDVRRLEIAVDHALAVRLGDALRGLVRSSARRPRAGPASGDSAILSARVTPSTISRTR